MYLILMYNKDTLWYLKCMTEMSYHKEETHKFGEKDHSNYLVVCGVVVYIYIAHSKDLYRINKKKKLFAHSDQNT